MQFDNEQVQQLKQVMQETIREEVPGIVMRIVADAEERIVTRITTSVGEMIEDNVLPQIQELREDIADIRKDLTEIRGDIAGLRSARWRLA